MRIFSRLVSRLVQYQSQFLTGAVLFSASAYADAGVTAGLCKAYNNFIGNELVGFAVGAGAIGLIIASALDEGGNSVKTGAIRLGAAGTAGVSINELVKWGTNGKTGFCAGSQIPGLDIPNINIPGISNAQDVLTTLASMLA